MSATIEKDWITEAGLRAVVLAMEMGHRCGYVGVPLAHPHYGRDYSDSGLYDIRVHGGLTYAGQSISVPVDEANPLHWFGFDCAHFMDAKDTSIMGPEYVKIYAMYPRPFDEEAVVRDLAFCERECESLAKQLGGLAYESSVAHMFGDKR